MVTFVSIIAAKFLTKRALNPNAVVATFTPIWQSKRGFKINNLGTHIILFTFHSESKVDTILANATWSFDKHLMILQKYDGVSKIEDLDFNSTLFWIQLHGLPIKFMTTTMVENLCKLAGQVLRLPNAKTEECGGFMRLRVMVDFSQPLYQGRVVTLEYLMIGKNSVSHSNMRGFPIFAIGVATSPTMIGTVITRLRVKVQLLMQTRNTGHG